MASAQTANNNNKLYDNKRTAIKQTDQDRSRYQKTSRVSFMHNILNDTYVLVSTRYRKGA